MTNHELAVTEFIHPNCGIHVDISPRIAVGGFNGGFSSKPCD